MPEIREIEEMTSEGSEFIFSCIWKFKCNSKNRKRMKIQLVQII